MAVHDEMFHKVHYLNHIAAAIFLLFKEPMSIETVITIVMEEYALESNPSTAMQSAIEEMLQAGLLRKVNETILSAR